MAWRNYKVILQICSPLHCGCGKIGNLQRTRPYLTGRSLWGALTMRLTRDKAGKGVAVNDSRRYQAIGEQIGQNLAFTYFYPALRAGGTYQVNWPWEDGEVPFRYRFLSSYTGTALNCLQQSAATGLLREVEFISPFALDKGEQVYLQGYIFEKEGCSLPWQNAIRHLQLGGERGYGWGYVKAVEVLKIDDNYLFGKKIKILKKEDCLVVRLSAGERILAHAETGDFEAAGEIEPLVGREWRSDLERNRYAGQHIVFNKFCFAPGSILRKCTEFLIDKYGVWRKTSTIEGGK
jgi:hypothetical protein